MKKAAAGNSVAGGYPACTICHENEGFAGRNKRTLRTIPATLGDEPWFWQFSPYGYFYQHGICVNDEHTPMHVSRSTFGHLLDFVDRFPGYFLGCNAALPRIGGSVLAHDHYQGGGELLPTETGFINRKMAKEHWRLGCQVKVKENRQDPRAGVGAGCQEVGVRGDLEPQHLDLYQGVRRETARG